LHVADLANRVAALLERLEQPLDIRQKRVARVGQPDAAAPAFEQLLAQLPLQALDAGSDRGLRQLKRLRRAAERMVARDLRESLNLTEIHGRRPRELLTLPIGGMNRIRVLPIVVKEFGRVGVTTKTQRDGFKTNTRS